MPRLRATVKSWSVPSLVMHFGLNSPDLRRSPGGVEQVGCPLSSLCAATWVRSGSLLGAIYLETVYKLLGTSTRALIYGISHGSHSGNVGRWWGGTCKTKGPCRSVNIHNEPRTPQHCRGRRFINSFMLYRPTICLMGHCIRTLIIPSFYQLVRNSIVFSMNLQVKKKPWNYE